MPKVRANSVLKNLPIDRQEEIYARLTEQTESWRDTSLQAVRSWLAQDGLITSIRALSEFRSWYAAQMDLQDTSDLLETFEEFTRKQNPDWSADKVRDVAIQFFMAHTVASKDVNKFVSVAQLDQNERFGKTKAKFEEKKIQLNERRVSLLEKKASQADAAAKITVNASLTPEQKEAEYRRIFGMS